MVSFGKFAKFLLHVYYTKETLITLPWERPSPRRKGATPVTIVRVGCLLGSNFVANAYAA